MKNLFSEEKGQGVMEYILISSLVGIFCLVAVKQVGKVLQKRVQNLKSSITREIPLHK
ncbi:MAG: Flp family type IVb pilin [Epsilonproteobacteria bacterium]|nr:MAG: Flp family type IVb pilin [Campylobacterota bacterium]